MKQLIFIILIVLGLGSCFDRRLEYSCCESSCKEKSVLVFEDDAKEKYLKLIDTIATFNAFGDIVSYDYDTVGIFRYTHSIQLDQVPNCITLSQKRFIGKNYITEYDARVFLDDFTSYSIKQSEKGGNGFWNKTSEDSTKEYRYILLTNLKTEKGEVIQSTVLISGQIDK